MQRQLAVSKTELAALINLPPGTDYSVAAPRNLKIESLRMPVRQMEEVALVRNPDIREASYQVRITADETRKMLARNLPGINFSYGPNYDSNSFLVNNTWTGGAVRLSANLISILSIPEQLKRGQLAEDTAITRRQALSMATLAQAAHRLSAVSRRGEGISLGRPARQRRSQALPADLQPHRDRCAVGAGAGVGAGQRRAVGPAALPQLMPRPRRRWAGCMMRSASIQCRIELASLDIATLSAAIRRSASDWDNNRLDRVSEADARCRDRRRRGCLNRCRGVGRAGTGSVAAAENQPVVQ